MNELEFMDFTISTYRDFLNSAKLSGYRFQPFNEFLSLSYKDETENKVLTLRHDVDKRPDYSLRFAELQHDAGIKGTYFFRIVPESFNEKIIRNIASLGHEIGYHYEDMDLCQGDVDKAILSFEHNLKMLRSLVPVSTICMHGSPRSPYDNRELWKKYNFRDYDLTGEPYLDLDFSKVAYYTDTGRRWDGHRVSVRDKEYVSSANLSQVQQHSSVFPAFGSTFDIIHALKKNTLPSKAMFTFHPQRWTDKPIPWIKELFWQNTKNVVKYFVIRWS